MQLKEVNITNPVQAYAEDFFAAVAGAGANGKVYEFEQDLPETTIRSKAALFGQKLGVKFSVVTVTPAVDGQTNGTFAVGITTKVRKPRTPKVVPSNQAEGQ